MEAVGDVSQERFDGGAPLPGRGIRYTTFWVWPQREETAKVRATSQTKSAVRFAEAAYRISVTVAVVSPSHSMRSVRRTVGKRARQTVIADPTR